jgi:hypothetical protein
MKRLSQGIIFRAAAIAMVPFFQGGNSHPYKTADTPILT